MRPRLSQRGLPFPARARHTSRRSRASPHSVLRRKLDLLPVLPPTLTLTLTPTRSTFYLCKQKSEGFQACELSEDFTQHYGENVYVCRA